MLSMTRDRWGACWRVWGSHFHSHVGEEVGYFCVRILRMDPEVTKENAMVKLKHPLGRFVYKCSHSITYQEKDALACRMTARPHTDEVQHL
jgi:hypothetical protein